MEERDGEMDFRSLCGLLVEGKRDGAGNFPRRCSLKMKVDLADPPDLGSLIRTRKAGRLECVWVA